MYDPWERQGVRHHRSNWREQYVKMKEKSTRGELEPKKGPDPQKKGKEPHVGKKKAKGEKANCCDSRKGLRGS